MKSKLVAALFGLSALALAQNAEWNFQEVASQIDAARARLALLGAVPLPHSSSLPALWLAQTLNFAQAGSPPDDREYQAGVAALDADRFDQAIPHFNDVIARKTARADGAYYWKAYAQNRTRHRADALATISELRRHYPQSRWLNDAQALEIEIHGQDGHPVSPGAESDQDLKLIAIQSLMQSDSAQAIPILKSLLRGSQSPDVKDRALFVLSQSGSPEGRQLLLDIARGKSDPDLQFKAVRYIGMMGGNESRGDLAKIYAETSDLNLKREIIRGYLLSGAKVQLLQAAKGEKNEDLRREAIRTLAQTGGKDELWSLYKSENSPDIQSEIVRAMLIDGDSGHLLEIAKTGKDPLIRKTAIDSLALTGWGKDNGAMVEMYRHESDDSIKRELIRGMFLQQDFKGLIELAKQEKDPGRKREIVQQLSLIHSKEATDYMLELLK